MTMTKLGTLHEFPKLLESYALDKLAQLPTQVTEKYKKIGGKKYQTYNIVSSLVQLNTSLKKQYINTLNCSSQIIEREGLFKTKLCRNRSCSYCNNIKTANLINGYQDQINAKIEEGKAYFLTLTRQNVKGEILRPVIQEMQKNFTNILRVLNERRNWKISGIRSFEVTYNLDHNTYHPHIHAIIWGENLPKDWQQVLIQEWQNRYNKTLVSKRGQDIKKADKGSFKELFKYVTKMTVVSHKNNKTKEKIKTFYPEVIDTTLRALSRLRVIQPFGNLKKAKISSTPRVIIDKSDNIRDIVWSWSVSDWHYIDDNGYIHDFTGNKPNFVFKPLKIPLKNR
jgi:plasmid rolling circle replication initiator protein Rep